MLWEESIDKKREKAICKDGDTNDVAQCLMASLLLLIACDITSCSFNSVGFILSSIQYRQWNCSICYEPDTKRLIMVRLWCNLKFSCFNGLLTLSKKKKKKLVHVSSIPWILPWIHPATLTSSALLVYIIHTGRSTQTENITICTDYRQRLAPIQSTQSLVRTLTSPSGCVFLAVSLQEYTHAYTQKCIHDPVLWTLFSVSEALSPSHQTLAG